MMRMRMKTTAVPPSPPRNGGGDENEWEMRPGGMLVQKRDPNSVQNRVPPPTIRVRVKYGSVYHEVSINSQASFGELKKMLSGPTGLHHEDQKLFYKDRGRDSKTFLDVVGVKDKSKIVLVEDPISQEKRYLEMRKTASMEKASKSIADISFEVDRLAGQVSALDSVISKGGKVPEKTVLNLIEMLMNQLIKLDGIVADGDVKLQRKLQVKRVQKYVETLDVLKVKNSTANGNGNHIPVQQSSSSNGNHVPVQQSSSSNVPQIPVQQQSLSNSGDQKLVQQPSRLSNNGNQVRVQQPKSNSGNQSPVHQPSKARENGNHIPLQRPSPTHKNQDQEFIFSNGQTSTPAKFHQSRRSVGHSPLEVHQPQSNQQPSRHSTSGSVVVTTQWETFDATPLPAPPPAQGSGNTTHSKFNWDLL